MSEQDWAEEKVQDVRHAHLLDLPSDVVTAFVAALREAEERGKVDAMLAAYDGVSRCIVGKGLDELPENPSSPYQLDRLVKAIRSMQPVGGGE